MSSNIIIIIILFLFTRSFYAFASYQNVRDYYPILLNWNCGISFCGFCVTPHSRIFTNFVAFVVHISIPLSSGWFVSCVLRVCRFVFRTAFTSKHNRVQTVQTQTCCVQIVGFSELIGSARTKCGCKGTEVFYCIARWLLLADRCGLISNFLYLESRFYIMTYMQIYPVSS